MATSVCSPAVAASSVLLTSPFHRVSNSRIVAPDAVVDSSGAATGDELVKNLHDHTYGITSDPLTQFAVVLSALIHDLDHPGTVTLEPKIVERVD